MENLFGESSVNDLRFPPEYHKRSSVSLLKTLVRNTPEQYISVVNDLLAQAEIHSGLKEDIVFAEAETALHCIDMLGTLISVQDSNESSFGTWLIKYRDLATYCNDSAKLLRNLIFEKLEGSFFFYENSKNIPVLSEEQGVQMQTAEMELEGARLEILKNGNTSKLDAIVFRDDGFGEETDLNVIFEMT